MNDPDHQADTNDLDDIVARYLDRINSGETLNPLEVLADYPGIGGEVLKDLQAYHALESSGAAPPLGTLGDYTLRRQIGRGGMGVVYDAWQNSMDRRVALKVLPVGVAVEEKAFPLHARGEDGGKARPPERRPCARPRHRGADPLLRHGMDWIKGKLRRRTLATWDLGRVP